MGLTVTHGCVCLLPPSSAQSILPQSVIQQPRHFLGVAVPSWLPWTKKHEWALCPPHLLREAPSSCIKAGGTDLKNTEGSGFS